tara:strand:- start:6848 stop:7321 length:474 start_codon:yes stop_codon:yes gene_type:complete
MANFYTAEAALQASNVDRTRISAEDVGGRQRIAIVKYTSVGTEANGNTLQLLKVTQPVIVDPTQSTIWCGGIFAGTSATIDIGDDPLWTVTPDIDRLCDGVSIFSAGLRLWTSGTLPAAVSVPYTTVEAGYLTATLNLGATATAGIDLTFRIVYTIK